MPPTQIASLALKLLGIYAIIKSLPILGSSPGMFAFADYDHMYMFLGGILPFILEFGAGAFLIVLSNKLACKMIVPDEKDAPTNQFTVSNLQTIAFSIIGIAMVAWAIPEISKIFANIQLLKIAGVDPPAQGIATGTKVYAIGLSVQFVVGLVLFFGAKGLSSFWHYLQRIQPINKTDT